MKFEGPSETAPYRPLMIIALVLVFVCTLSAAQQAGATPIPVGASDLIFNFDFTAQTPAPPYTSLNIVWNISGWDAGEVITLETFGDPDGVNLLSSFALNGPKTSATIDLFNSGAVGDGIFSVGARLSSGAADFTSVTATEYAPFADFDTIGRGIPVSITITAPVASVPESTTLVLLVCGLVALGSMCRRKVS